MASYEVKRTKVQKVLSVFKKKEKKTMELATLCGDTNRLRDKIMQLKMNLHKLELSKAYTEASKAALSDKLTEERQRASARKDLEREAKESTQQCQQAQTRVKMLEKENDHLLLLVSENSERYEQSRVETEVLQKRISDLETQLQTSTVQQPGNLNEDRENTWTELTIGGRRSSANQLRAENEKLRQQLEVREAHIVELEDKIHHGDPSDEYQALRQENSELLRRRAVLSTNLAEIPLAAVKKSLDQNTLLDEKTIFLEERLHELQKLDSECTVAVQRERQLQSTMQAFLEKSRNARQHRCDHFTERVHEVKQLEEDANRHQRGPFTST